MSHIEQAREAKKILAGIRGSKLGLVGDLCLDLYLFLDEEISERSVETGLETRSVRRLSMAPGGGANAARNAAELGAKVSVFGIVGDDMYGRELVRELEAQGIDTEGVAIQNENWATSVYTKLYAGDREEPRLDLGNFNKPSEESCDRVLASLEAALDGLDALMINDQLLAGINTDKFRERVVGLIAKVPKLIVAVDSRSHAGLFPKAIRKVNFDEALALLGENAGTFERSDSGALALADKLRNSWRAPLILTRGDRGLVLGDDSGTFLLPGLHSSCPVDPVGAGDCLLAAFTAAIASGTEPRAAARFANIAATVTVRKRFETGTASPAEIIALEEEGDYRYNVDVGENPAGARLLSGTSIELIAEPCRRPLPRHIVFDNDGTLSTLREGWEPVMEEVMIEALLGPGPAPEATRRRAREEARNLIEESTGVRTIEQMRMLRGLVLEMGRVKPESVRSAADYKRIYIGRLNAKIASRIEGLASGRYAPEDFMIKGSEAFLALLDGAGIVLHLASGTDQQSVETEIRALGAGGFFEGRIEGARDEASEDPKREALRRIVAEIEAEGGDAGSIAVFGDGPVEMREARKREIVAVGVASDEARRLGFNPAKRRRLIEGGADILIPDFSDPEAIFRALGWDWPKGPAHA
jgi:rfaE bifunctional protein kinase chain/domain